LFILPVATLLFAKEDANKIDELFLQTINETSEIAMYNRLNIDKIPSAVTIVKQDIIKASGAKTLLDILELISGIEISMNDIGKRQIIIRGMRGKHRDKLKLLLNGVDATNNLHSNQFYYYTFPASLIKRVEVTKTPNALLNDETLLGNLKDLLEKYPIDPSLIDIEITETLQMEDVETSIKMLQEIKRLGFKVSIDDFGTGYSSLNLKRFPFDVIKRDREFVKDMYKNKEDIILVK